MDSQACGKPDISGNASSNHSPGQELGVQLLDVLERDRYMIPPCFWGDVSRLGNGFFGCQDDYNEEGKAEGHGTWFQLLAKRPSCGDSARGTPYKWHKMDFVTKWSPPNQNVVLCFSTSRDSQDQLRDALSSRLENRNVCDPYMLHTVIVDEVLSIFDRSVWSLRDLVLSVEKVVMPRPRACE
ncbi:hypothetical protein GP486_006846 [Trichoglossum hirsutum]|uniref:Uncharacterized protein n=1 Tax=Trichoglossum hirsutum TaxID=265104 RepID=A0A9P8L5A2_9PEZI|nr:hypothetical protein GP486_006846 [Trichoglossum hirsutum]